MLYLYLIHISGKPVEMTPKEYDLFFYMVRNRGIALTREKLITNVWGYDFYGDDRTLDTHIKDVYKRQTHPAPAEKPARDFTLLQSFGYW